MRVPDTRGGMENPALAATHLPQRAGSKVEAVKRPTISAAGTTQDWVQHAVLHVQMATKAAATGLRRDLQRNSGGCWGLGLWLR